MTPKERQLVDELFDKLASLENGPRDAEAMRAIGEGLQRAPNAVYPLVQTVLLQDEALKQADARVRELEAELGVEPGGKAEPGGFLDGMRDTLGRRELQGSVPSVRPGGGPQISSAWRTAPMSPAEERAQPALPPQRPGSPAGSFLGTAAATAAGVIGGALLMNSLRGMFGGGQGQTQSALNPAHAGAPWSSGAGGGELARDAGLNDIGGGKTAQIDGSQRAGLFDVASNEPSEHDDDAGLDDDFDLSGDSDVA